MITKHKKSKRTGDEQWDAKIDLATPQERKWIDAWVEAGWRGNPNRFKVLDRSEDGKFRWLTVRMGRYKTVLRMGVMAITLEQMKDEVRKNRASERRELAKQAVRETGAYI